MKIIFLDIDGVMNHASLIHSNGMHSIGEEALDLLKSIVFQTNAKIVLSSTWRLNENNRIRVKNALATRDLEFIDRTESLRGPRANEIKEWLDRHPEVVKFAILDDDDDAGIFHKNEFFETDFEIGLTDQIARKVVKHLNEV